MSAKKSTAAKKSAGFSAEEKAAMKERARELKAEAQKADGEAALLAKVAEMQGARSRDGRERLHAIVTKNAPGLMPKTWYGMPAYAKDGKVLCFFQSADKFGSRYASFGFSDEANLDDGAMWPIYFALKKLTARRREADRRAREAGGELRAGRDVANGSMPYVFFHTPVNRSTRGEQLLSDVACNVSRLAAAFHV